MIGLTDLLKEGYRVEGAENFESTLSNIKAVKALAATVRTSFGPNGMNKMIVNSHGKIFVTSDCATIVNQLDIMHPAAKMTVLASQMQDQEIGDGTNFVLILTGELLQNAETLIQKGLHPSQVIGGYTKAQEFINKALEDDSLVVKTIDEKQIYDKTQVMEGLASCIASKQFGFEKFLSSLIADACLQVVPKNNPRNFNVDSVRVVKVLGGGVMDSKVIHGFVLPRSPEGVIHKVENAKVAIYASGIDVVKSETKDTVLIKTAEELLNYNKSEEEAMEEFVKSLVEVGTNLVICGGTLGEMALHFFERYQIMVVKCPSKFDLRRVANVVNATPVLKLVAPTPDQLGFAEVAYTEEIGSDRVTIVRNDQGSSVSTVLIRGSTQNILDDFERAIDDGVNVYKAMAKDGRFVAGAGACEIELGQRLNNYADSTKTLHQYAMKKYAEAFEVIPRILTENAGFRATETLPHLYAAHQKGEKDAGLDIESGEVVSVSKLGVYDLLSTKTNAIRLATNTALTVLRISQIIMSKPSGGPKPPRMGGGMDSMDDQVI